MLHVTVYCSFFILIVLTVLDLKIINLEKCNPLQYSCLENPRDRGAWWAAICGVTQRRTRLK